MTRCAAAVGLAVLACGCSRPQAQPRVVADFAGYSEGIVFDSRGAAFASVLHKQSVAVIREPAPPEHWYRVTEPNGHKVLPDGTHLIAARGGIHHVAPDGTLIDVLAPQLATPNDLALDGDGGVYITVPAESEQGGTARRGAVYYLDAARALHKVADDFCYPNGILVRPDGRTLVVGDSCGHQIDEFDIASPGVLVGRRTWADLTAIRAVPDGMTLDQSGRLYVADYGRGVVLAFDSSGRIIREYPTGLDHPSNVAFGGPGLTDLYVTGSPAGEDGRGRLVVLPLGLPGRSNLALPASIHDR